MSEPVHGIAGATVSATDIAVVGMAGRFPGARSVAEFWENLQNGVEAVTVFTDAELRAAGVDRASLRNPQYVKSGAPLPDMECFDASFFGFSPRDASIMDPQHRHFLECSWEALESAGYTVAGFPGTIGIFGGSGQHAYLMYNLLTNPALMQSVGMFLVRHTGNDKDFLTTRVSYLLNLTGPSVNIQTACSTSLVAIHIAAQSLLSGECDMALAGGVTVEVPHRRGYEYRDGEILSPDGHCRAFDAKSQGTIFGSGVGIVALRRLTDAVADGDTIHAVIKGSAVNNDGSLKAGYLAPSVEGQAKAVSEALAISGVEPDTITYIEAHGTGTPVGDPIEVAALTQAFRIYTDERGFCGIGSLKTNIGHLDTAAGVAGFIKTVKALESGVLPATLNFTAPNPAIDFERSPFYVASKRTDWQPVGGPRRAGVNSLGVGGTNAFVVLEEPPALAPSSPARRPEQLLTLSAKTEAALDAATERLVRHLRQHPDQKLADVAYTLQVGRTAFNHRRVVVAPDAAVAADALEQRDPKRVVTHACGQTEPSLVFMFPGGGAQHPNMARQLYETEPVYRQAVDACLNLAGAQAAAELKRLMFPPPGTDLDAVACDLERPSAALPALFVTEYALAKLWMSWGITPAAMTGHSMGEYTAACLAGVMSVADALSLVTLRGELFETLPEGAMLGVRCTEDRLRPILGDELDLAAINGPELCLASGPAEAINRLAERLTAAGVEFNRLKISVAAHSRMLEPILEEFGRRVAQFQLRPPTLRWMSNLTGAWITPDEATSPTYWVRHLREAVRFSDGIQALLNELNPVFLEVGPGQTLTSLVKAHLSPKTAQHAVIPSSRHPREAVADVQFLLTSLGRAWLTGAAPDWRALHGDERRRRVELPTYPFERQRHWIEPGKPQVAETDAADPLAKVDSIDDWFYRPHWVRTEPAVLPVAAAPLTWLIFRDQLGLGDELAQRLQQAGSRVISVSPGAAYAATDEAAYVIRSERRADYDRLVADLAARRQLPQRIVHLWSVSGATPSADPLGAYESSQTAGFFSLLYLAQALGSEDLDAPLHIGVVSDRMQPVNGEVTIRPERATILGPCAVIPREYPATSCVSIDVSLPAALHPDRPELLRNGSAASLGRAVDQLLAELAVPGDDRVIALRDGDRWVERFEAATFNAPEEPQTGLREGGVYLISGGLGGIGLVQAEYLARTARARLVLVGRSGLPDRSEWEAWLALHAPQDTTSRRIRSVLALEQLGAEVMVASADVADLQQMREIVAEARARFGQIHGVIHAAGILNDGVVQLKTRETAESVLDPKVRGALVLDAALADEQLDFFVLFSSTSSILGPAGQVDYVGANAFLNAFAHSKAGQRPTRTIALDWGVWQEVGMAARAAGAEPTAPTALPAGTLAGHPLLGLCIGDTAQHTVFQAHYSAAEQWTLHEHRLTNGQAVLPGTGYLEVARAALHASGEAGPLVLEDVFFLAPLLVGDTDPTTVRITVERDITSAALTVETDGGSGQWREHARATQGTYTGTALPQPQDLAALRARCAARTMTIGPGDRSKQEQHIAFGSRWRNLRRVDFGADEALGWLELPESFADDLAVYAAHPALLDIAAHIGLPLIEGYAQSEDFYVPFSCKRVQFHAPLTRTLYSHVRYRAHSADRGLGTFDVALMDEHGAILVEIDEFAVKRLDGAGLAAARHPSTAAPASSGRSATTARDGAPDLLRLGLTEGILPAEGAQALHRLLAGCKDAQVVASSLDLHALMAQLASPARPGAAGSLNGARMADAGESSGYVAPRNDVERTLAGFWQELMGLERVGIHDDFFDLGGYSLIAVRLFAKIKKAFGVDLALDTLFQASTIERCAEIVAAELGIELDVMPVDALASADPAAANGTDHDDGVDGSHGAVDLDDARMSSTNGAGRLNGSTNGHSNGAGRSNGAARTPRPTQSLTDGLALHRRDGGWSPLVPIQPQGSRMPFFFVHGAGGNVLNFRELSRRLGKDQPFYGLQAQGVDGKRTPLQRVEDMAALYLRELRRVRPEGPYLLGGFSGGGVIALEMAQQLLRDGDETALLVMLDTFCPTLPSRRGLVGNVKNLIRFGPGYALCLPKKTADSVVRKFRRLQVRALEAREQSLPHGLRDQRMWDANLRALGAYRPAQYPGRVTLFRATISDPLEDCGLDDLGWSHYIDGGIEILRVPGTHDDMVLEPNVASLVEQLSHILDRVGAAQEAGRR